MALPRTISGPGFDPNVLSKPYRHTNGYHYVVLPDSGGVPTSMGVYRADNGDNTWSEIDASNAPTLTQEVKHVAAVLDGDTLHIATSYHDIGDVFYEYHTFSISSDGSTDAWGTKNETIQSNVDADTTTTNMQIHLCVRSNGDVVAVFIGTSDKIMGTDYTRVDYIIRSSGTWGSPVAVDGGGEIHYLLPRCVLGASDKVHIVYWDSSDIQHKSLTSGGTLSSAEAVNDSSVSETRGIGIDYFDDAGDETVVIRWGKGSPAYGMVSEIINDGTPSAEVQATDSTTNPPQALTVAAGDGTYQFLYAISSSLDLFLAEYDGASWGTDVEVLDAVTINAIAGANVYEVDNGDTVLGHVYDDGAVKYNEYVLATGSGAQTISATVGTIAFGGQAASVVPGAVSISAGLGTIASAGQAATITNVAVVPANVGTIAFAGQTATIIPGAIIVAANLGTLAIAGQAATVSLGGSSQTINATVGTIALAGQAASVVLGGVTIAGTVGNLAYAGQASSIIPGGVVIASTVGTLAFAGQAAIVSPGGVSISASLGALSLAGQTATIIPGAVSIGANTGALTFLGHSAGVGNIAVVQATVGVVSYGGQAANVVPGAVSVPATVGALSLSGHSASILANVAISAALAQLALAGQAASVVPGSVSITATVGNLTFAGLSATISVSFLAIVDDDDVYTPMAHTFAYIPQSRPFAYATEEEDIFSDA